jgi:hypothetical protein
MTRHLGLVCGCQECLEWDVATEPQRRVPAASGGARWIHGRELRQWLNAKAEFEAAARAAVGARGRHGRMERLAEPMGGHQ